MSNPDQLAEIKARRVRNLMAAVTAEDHGLAEFIIHAPGDIDWLLGTLAEILKLVELGLTTDGAHHKQWFLEQIAMLYGVDELNRLQTTGVGYEPGIAP